MPTNIWLDQGKNADYVVVEGRVLKTTTSDFIVDNPSRRGKGQRGQKGPRRALVHDAADGLTINYNNDYPGGVTINDVVALNSHHRFGLTLDGVREIGGVSASRLGETTGTTLKKQLQPSLVLRGDIQIEVDLPAVPGKLRPVQEDLQPAGTTTVSLQDRLASLQKQVETLVRRLAELERRGPEEKSLAPIPAGNGAKRGRSRKTK